MDIPSSIKSFVLFLSIIILLPLTSGVLHAQAPDPTVAEQTLGYDEAEAYAIDGMIMCPVCPAETIGQAQVPIARQMRQIVRDMLSEGATRQEILDFFAERYGQDILASPPKSGFNLVAWIIPLAGVAAALVAGLLVLRSMSARRAGQTASVFQFPDSDSALEPYLELVDQELASRQNFPVTERDNSDRDASESLGGSVPTHQEGS